MGRPLCFLEGSCGQLKTELTESMFFFASDSTPAEKATIVINASDSTPAEKATIVINASDSTPAENATIVINKYIEVSERRFLHKYAFEFFHQELRQHFFVLQQHYSIEKR